MNPASTRAGGFAAARSLRQFFQALGLRMLQETAVAFAILALLLSLVVPSRTPGLLTRLFVEDVLPAALAALLLYAALLFGLTQRVRRRCERVAAGQPGERTAALETARLPFRLFLFGLLYWAAAWVLVAAGLHRTHGSAVSLPTAIGGVLAALTAQVLGFYRNRRAFFPVTEALAERLGIAVPAAALGGSSFQQQLQRTCLLLAGGVALLATGVLLLQAGEVAGLLAGEDERAALWRYTLKAALAVAVFAFGLAALLVHFLSRELRLGLDRLRRSADRLAAGDLRREPATHARDETGAVAAAQARVAARLRQIARESAEQRAQLDGAVQAASGHSVRLVDETHALADALQLSGAGLGRGVTAAAASFAALASVEERAEAHAAAARELDALAESVVPALGSLSAAFASVGASLQEARDTVDQQDGRVDALQELSISAAKQVTELSQLVLKVRRLTEESGRVHSRVQAGAESGASGLRTRQEGLLSIQETISWASQSIGSLGERSQEIGGILSVIKTIAKQTNMLSLNAAIIAAQAGEHGPGFNVIADEIRALAEKTSAYTKMVEELVGTMVHGTDKAIEAMLVCFDRLSAEMEASRATEQLLEQIAEGAQEAREMNQHILSVTEQEVETGAQARLLSEELDKEVGALGRALKEQLVRVRVLAEGFSGISGMLQTLAPTAAQQRKRSAALAAELGEARAQVRRLHRELDPRLQQLREAAMGLESARERALGARRAGGELNDAVESLRNQLGRLGATLERLRLR
jgi:methyl-accepting chemotaxis protein